MSQLSCYPLFWYGPITLANCGNLEQLEKELESAAHPIDNPPTIRLDSPGVYFQAILENEAYRVIYIGKADRPLRIRLKEHFEKVKESKYSLLETHDRKLMLDVWAPNYHEKGENHAEMVELNLQMRKVLLANLPELPKFTPKQIEGALQARLSSRGRTREALGTGVSTWQKLGISIESRFAEGICVEGFEQPIKVPRNDGKEVMTSESRVLE